MFLNRYEKLKLSLLKEVNNDLLKMNNIMNHINKYEKDNLDTIKKLKKERLVVSKKINGAIIQTINVHGDITKKLSGSLTKRIIGSLLTNEKKDDYLYNKHIFLFTLFFYFLFFYKCTN